MLTVIYEKLHGNINYVFRVISFINVIKKYNFCGYTDTNNSDGFYKFESKNIAL